MKLVESSSFEGVNILRVGQNPVRQPKLTVNLFSIDRLLIDTGPPRMFHEIWDHFKDQDLNQIFVTHHHEDHTGNVAQLSRDLNCPAYSSILCAEMMKNPPKISFAQYAIWGNRPAFHDLQGISGSITTENYEFELINIPGHAPDMVALYEPHRKWLFSADLYVHHYISYFLFSESVSQQIQSLKILLTLDFDSLFCCHVPPMKDGREKLEKKLRFLTEFESSVKEEASKGHSARTIMKKLKLQERWDIRLLSHGMLSKLNMVKSVLRDLNT